VQKLNKKGLIFVAAYVWDLSNYRVTSTVLNSQYKTVLTSTISKVGFPKPLALTQTVDAHVTILSLKKE
jgi:hypothetical protein